MTALSQKALNRALLARQLLLRRESRGVAATVEHLVGMQAQAPNPPYIGLWTRLEHFAPDDLARLILDRQLVRVALMRGTIHLVTAPDCLLLRPLVQPLFDRDLATNPTHGGEHLAGVDLAELATLARTAMAERPRTNGELHTLLGARWPERDPTALVYAARGVLPLVQVPPRGIWGKGGQPTSTTAQAWLGRELDPDPAPDEMVLRYLAAFGPATVRDVQAWSGLTRLVEVTDRLGTRLRQFAGENGATLLDVPDGPRPDPDTPAPPRFIPQWDNLLLSHADRTRVISDEARRAMITRNGQVLGTVLVDGFVRGSWKAESDVLQVNVFRRLSKKDTAAVTREGMRLLGFLAPEAAAPDVRVVEASTLAG